MVALPICWEGYCVPAPQPREFGILQARNGAEQFNLRSIFELGLESDHVPQRAQLVVLTQLDYGIRPAALREFGRAIARIVEPDRLNRPEPPGLHPPLCPPLNPQNRNSVV